MNNGNFTHDAGMVGAGVSGTSGLMLWFGENATAIGAMVTVATFLITVLFMVLNYMAILRKIKLEEEEKRRKDDK